MELLSGSLSFLGEDLEDIESDSLGQRSALTSNDDITILNVESWGAVDWGILMSLLESVVLSDEVQIISSDDDSSGHLGGNNNTLNNSSSDGDITSEWALSINVSSFNGFSWGLEAQSDVSIVSQSLGGLGSEDLLAAEGNTVLLVIESLDFSHFRCV